MRSKCMTTITLHVHGKIHVYTFTIKFTWFMANLMWVWSTFIKLDYKDTNCTTVARVVWPYTTKQESACVIDAILQSRQFSLPSYLRRTKWPILGGFGGFHPSKCDRPSFRLQKTTCLRDYACFDPLCVKIHPLVTSVGEFRKKLVLYFTYLARRYLKISWHKFWVMCSTRGRNQLCKVLS